MGFLDTIFPDVMPLFRGAPEVRTRLRRGHHAPGRHQVRSSEGYEGGEIHRLYEAFKGSGLNSDEALKRSLELLRKRSRKAAMDVPYMRKFLSMVRCNVVGPTGLRLNPKLLNDREEPDDSDNTRLEKEWSEWTQKGVCDVTGKLSFVDVQRLFIETVARDGEGLIRLVPNHPNRFGFALQVLEGDYLDVQHNQDLRDDGQVVMSVEKDAWGKPRAYHLLTAHPGAGSLRIHGRNFLKVPASEIVHEFICERPEQTRGVPWASSSILAMSMLHGYQEAEITAARYSSSNPAVLINPDGEWDGDESNPDATPEVAVEPGTIPAIPSGWNLQSLQANHPTTAYEAFVKNVLRQISSGLDVGYNSLASDGEKINFSTLRGFTIADRDGWRVLQDWLARSLCMPVFNAWLNQAFLMGVFDPVPPRRIDKFRRVEWQGRGWDWVDPLKDIDADTKAVQLGAKTRTQIAQERGRDWKENVIQLAKEEAFMREHGLEIGPPESSNPGQPPEPPAEEEPEGEETD